MSTARQRRRQFQAISSQVIRMLPEWVHIGRSLPLPSPWKFTVFTTQLRSGHTRISWNISGFVLSTTHTGLGACGYIYVCACSIGVCVCVCVAESVCIIVAAAINLPPLSHLPKFWTYLNCLEFMNLWHLCTRTRHSRIVCDAHAARIAPSVVSTTLAHTHSPE